MGRKQTLIRVGCCGFRSSRESYYRLLDPVAVQHTFYQPPQVSTLKKWREEAPEGFEFTLKAWQLITHKASSPTYRRVKRQLTEEEKEGAGSFRPTPAVAAAWELTRESVANLRKFFKKARRDGLNFCWEPRGGWPRETVRGLCEELDLWHVVDPFAERTTTPARCYFRLHGRRGWRYKYEEGELEELHSMLPEGAVSYVFFNNVEMGHDAVRFKEIVEAA